MGTKVSTARARALLSTGALLGALVALVALPGDRARAGVAVTPLSELRIEGPRKNIEPGTWYATPPERIKRSRGLGCKRREGTRDVPPSALSIADTASDASAELPAVRVRNDSFGLFVCEIGGLVGRSFDDPDGFSGWTYWVDFAGGTQAAENESLTGNERVLWVFSDFGERNLNTDDALELSGVPPHDPDGTFTVQVSEHEFGGAATPLAGAKIKGAESFDDLGGGTYEVTAPGGRTELWAKHKPDIASNRLSVCVRPSAGDCPAAHGRSIVGSPDADGLLGTAGWDEIRARAGNDRIDIATPGRDDVNCGAGTDTVTVIQGDADNDVAANCEEIVEVE